jgi:uncharacterized membrane protein YwzB
MPKPNVSFLPISPTILNHFSLQIILGVNVSDFLFDYANAIRMIYFTYFIRRPY